jgi:hypothetical protein
MKSRRSSAESGASCARLGARLLERGEAVDALGELGQRREDARVRPARAVGDEGERLATLDEGLGGAEGEVLDRDKRAGDGVEVVAE